MDFDLKGDRKDAYGPWLLVKRKKARAKTEGLRNTNQGMEVGPSKGHFRYGKALPRHVNMTHEKPPYNVRYGSDKEKKGGRPQGVFKPTLIQRKEKATPIFHETEASVLSRSPFFMILKVLLSFPSVQGPTPRTGHLLACQMLVSLA